MRRRNFLHMTGAVGALAVAGCVGGDEEPDDGTADGQSGAGTTDETDDSTPEETPTPAPEGDDDLPEDDDADELGEHEYDHPGETVEAFLVAWQDGDVEAVNALLYDGGELEPVDDSEAEEFVDHAPGIEELDSADVDGKTATVDVVLTAPDGDETEALTFELTLVDEAWKISDLRPQTQEVAPQAHFDFDVEDGELTIMHTAGDAVPADELYIRGDGLGETGAWHELSDDIEEDEDVTAGERLTIDVENEYSITLVWDDGSDSATLHSHSGARESDSVETDPVGSHLENTENYDGTVEDFTDEDEVSVTVGATYDDDPLYFDPPAVRVDEETTVVWEWTGDGAAHNVSELDGAFESDVKDEEEATFSHTFEERGTYLYVCQPHRAIGMKGAVVVE